MVEDSSPIGTTGFPLRVELNTGGSITLDLNLPTPLDCLDERQVGLSIIDPMGKVKCSWGLAKRLPALREGKSVLNSPLSLIPECLATGESLAFYHDGYRVFASVLNQETKTEEGTGAEKDVLALIVNASEEKGLLSAVHRTERQAQALRRLGKAMAVEEGALKVAIAAAHEIASCADLAAVLVWVLDEVTHSLKLAASVGLNRTGQQVLSTLSLSDTPCNLAEIAAATGKEAFCDDLHEDANASEVEGKFCYLKPGGLAIYPLVTAERTVGVLEVVGKADDPTFRIGRELFQTFSEHLTLALNAALMYESAEKRASHDGLTGLANHKTLHEFLFTRLAEAKRHEHPLGVLMIDVDHFRAFNEEEGHDAGDTVLKLVADAIRSCLRPYDLASRYGGEEFTVVIPKAGPDYIAMVGERIRERIERQSFVTPSGEERGISASLGGACFPENQAGVNELLKAADAALYQAKKQGRNRMILAKGWYEPSANEAKPEINVDEWIEPELAESSEAGGKKVLAEIEFLVRRLGLSEGQREILKALCKIAPTYLHWLETGNSKSLKAVESDSQLRSLAPSLLCLQERFDGQGPRGLQGKKIPLLGRILPILIALGQENGSDLVSDPHRYDPEIVHLLADLSSAA